MFDRLAASPNIAFKWPPMFDLHQTFSSNMLRYEQMFDRLATSARQSLREREIATSQKRNLCDILTGHVVI